MKLLQWRFSQGSIPCRLPPHRSEARFRPEHVPAAGPIYRKTEQLQLHHSGSRPSGLQRGFPSNSSLNSLGQARSEGAAQAQRPAGGEYRCATAFPSAEQVCCGD